MGVENAMAMAVASSGFLCVLARLIYLVRQWPSQKDWGKIIATVTGSTIGGEDLRAHRTNVHVRPIVPLTNPADGRGIRIRVDLSSERTSSFLLHAAI